MNEAHKKLEKAWESAAVKPDLFAVPTDLWQEYFDGLTPEVRKIYQLTGFYRIYTRKGRLTSYVAPFRVSVKAITYKATPVVCKDDYRDMMRGHKSSRKVVEL